MYELQGKRPASAVTYDARPVILMTAAYHRKADLIAAVSRQAGRGQVRPLDPRPVYDERTGQWCQRVLQLRPPAPAWIRPAIVLGTVLIVLALLGALAWWVLTTLAGSALALFCLAAFGALVMLTRTGRRQTVSIVNNNYVRMR